MDLLIRSATAQPSPVEIVERKGLGHPDTICDGVAEHISRALCRHYREVCGLILHHNVDKVLLVGGGSRVAFGGGEVSEPVELYLAGRAAHEVQGKPIPVPEIAVEAARDWLRHNLRYLDPERDVRIIPRIRPGSAELTALFAQSQAHPRCNDTSCGVGFAPLSALERMVLAVERSLNSHDVKLSHPAIGEDIKVMGVRKHDQVTLTIGCAFVARHIASLAAYEREKEAVRELALAAARAIAPLHVEAQVNAADDLAHGDVYLTVTGTSAESGDDGEVGRGNRANGLITPYRPMTMEAAAGKNPVSHVGKIYNVAAGRIASSVARELPSVQGVSCALVSQIGRAVDDPHVAEIALTLDPACPLEGLHAQVGDIVRSQLARLAELREQLVSGELTVY